MLEDRSQVVNRVDPLPWFAVRVRSNYERVTAEHLRSRGYDEFSPHYVSESRWSDRRKRIERPLFPGYVFSRFDPYYRLPVLTVPGVVGILGFGKGPCPVPDVEVESVRRMVRSGLMVTPWPFLRQGQQVLLERGPLAGLEGIIREVKGKLRVVVSVTILQRSVSAEIDSAWLAPLNPSHSYTRLTHGAWVQRQK